MSEDLVIFQVLGGEIWAIILSCCSQRKKKFMHEREAVAPNTEEVLSHAVWKDVVLVFMRTDGIPLYFIFQQLGVYVELESEPDWCKYLNSSVELSQVMLGPNLKQWKVLCKDGGLSMMMRVTRQLFTQESFWTDASFWKPGHISLQVRRHSPFCKDVPPMAYFTYVDVSPEM